MTEPIHWRNQGHALLIPQIKDEKYDIEDIR